MRLTQTLKKIMSYPLITSRGGTPCSIPATIEVGIYRVSSVTTKCPNTSNEDRATCLDGLVGTGSHLEFHLRLTPVEFRL
jgi:hypothetical protein